MEQRRFCAACKAPAVKDARFCVVCGSSEFVAAMEDNKVKAVEIDDAVVTVGGCSGESRFVRNTADADSTVRVPTSQEVARQDGVGFCGNNSDLTKNAFGNGLPQDIYETTIAQPPFASAPVQTAVAAEIYSPAANTQSKTETLFVHGGDEPPSSCNVINYQPQEKRTVSYKSFEEYERELSQTECGQSPKPVGKGRKILKRILIVLLCIAMLLSGFVGGVALTYFGYLNEYLEVGDDTDYEQMLEDMEKCYEVQGEMANLLAEYISENGIFVDKTTVITVEIVDDTVLYDVEGDCITSADCAELFDNDYVCPSDGKYTLSLIPYVDGDGKSMFKVEVSCDGGDGDYLHK